MAEQLYRKRIVPSSNDPTVDDIVNKNVLAQLRRDPPPKVNHEASKTSADADLLASMAKRLGYLEKELKEKSGLALKFQAENEALKNKLLVAEEEIARRGAVASSAEEIASSSHLRSENTRLRNQVHIAWQQVAQMKQFLSDYGMVWVGPTQQELDQQRMSNDGAGSEASSRPSTGASGLPKSAKTREHPRGGRSSGSGCITEKVILPPIPSHVREGDGCVLARSASGPGRPIAAVAEALPFQVSELASRLEELNQLANDGVASIVSGPGNHGHVLSTPEAIKLTIYRNGLQLHKMPPKPYSDPSAEGILKDILDGYFPYALKSDFPDGVPIRLMDKSKEPIPTGRSLSNGRAVGNMMTFDDIESGMHDGAPIAREKFLSKLPHSVIRNGKVIEVRGDVLKMMNGSESKSGSRGSDNGSRPEVSIVNTPIDALMSTGQRGHAGPVMPPSSRGKDASETLQEVTTLQVKSEDGKQTYIVKLGYQETVASLRKYIDSHRKKHAAAGSGTLGNYEIRCAFPARTLSDLTETMVAAELVPNGTLFLRAL